VNLGAEPKKVVVLGGLLLVGGYFFYTNVISDSSDTPRQPGPLVSQSQAVNGALNAVPPARGPIVRASTRSKSSEEFHPTLKRKPEDALDPMTVDPKVRIDLLAKVQNVEILGGGRNPFQFGTPPPPPAPPAPKIDLKKLLEAKNNPPKPVEPPKPAAPAGPPPLNLSWKYYGYASPRSNPVKKAFFLIPSPDGDEILTANEGEVLKRKYRVVRIGVNSVVVEDTDTKSRQTLPLAEETLG
jgi:hypothetical protein